MAEYISREAVKNEFGELFTLCRETLPNENGHHFVVEKELQIAFDHLMSLPVADAIEHLLIGNDFIAKEFRDCRNELCMQCGSYKQAHIGACDGCRWKE